MPASHQIQEATINGQSANRSVAPWWHTILLILLILAPLIQARLAESQQNGSARTSPRAVPLYVVGAIVECIFFLFAWWGIRLRKNSLASVTGRRWVSWRETGRDVSIAFLFWGVWYGSLSLVKLGLSLAGIPDSGTSGMVYPHRALEIALWIPNAVLAGFVEEFVFRGYLMRQFAAWTRSLTIGLILQAILFGVGHAYLLGLRQVIVISASGFLVGLFVIWQKNLRSAMVFHGWADIFGAIIVRGLPFQ